MFIDKFNISSFVYLFLSIFLIENSSAQQKEIFEYPDGKIAYQKFGNGYPVLIINGGPGMNSEGFAPLAEMLSENNTIIIYDQRGTGKSKLNELNSSSISMDLMVEDIEKLREELGYDQWIVLGHSFGGMLSYAYAAKYPHRVKAMIQSHSGGMSLDNTTRFDVRKRLTSEENDSLVHYSLLMQSSPGNPKLVEKRAKYLAKAYLVDSKHEKTVTNRLLQVNRDINGMIWSDMRAMLFDVTSEMKKFNKPVLIMHGLEDVVPIDIAERSSMILPNSKLIKMADCGHYGWLDRPEVYLKEVKTFLKKNS